MTQDSSKWRYVFTIFDDFTEEYKLKHNLISAYQLVTIEMLEAFLTEHAKVWSFQQEYTAGQRVHFQGRLSLRKKKTKKLFLKMFVDWIMVTRSVPLNYAMHWLTLVTVSPEQDFVNSFKYTKKDESRVPGTFRCFPPIYDGRDIECMDSTNPKYAWQAELDKIILNSESDRTVIVVYDPVGGAGKSKWIKKQLFYNSNAIYVPIENTLERTLAALANQPAKSLYLLDVPRGNRTTNSWFDLFKLCENLKNGMLTSSFGGKYAINLYDTATVVVMTNVDIKSDNVLYSQLSSDRWKLLKITRYPFDEAVTLTWENYVSYNDMESRPYPGIR